MKSRILCLLLLVGFFVSLSIPFIPTKTYAAGQDALARTECAGAFRDSDDQGYCVGGWLTGSYASASGSSSGGYSEGLALCTQYGGDPNDSGPKACAIGYGLGFRHPDPDTKPSTTPSTDESKPAPTNEKGPAALFCRGKYADNKDKYDACKAGYNRAISKGGSSYAFCSKLKHYNVCTKGWIAGLIAKGKIKEGVDFNDISSKCFAADTKNLMASLHFGGSSDAEPVLDSGSKSFLSCVDGFLTATQNLSGDKAKYCASSGLDKDACSLGWDLAVNEHGQEVNLLSSICGVTGTATYPSCSAGVLGYLNGKSQEEACASVASKNKNTCKTAYNSAKTASEGVNDKSDNTVDCESNVPVFGWLFCGAIKMLSNAVEGIYVHFIEPLLFTNPVEIRTPENDPTKTFQVWSNFRVYGDIFLVIALLVIVFSQSLGGGVVEAYTAKKVLPRLLVAAILINISIYLVAGAIDIANVIGKGISSLMQAPFGFGGADALKLHITVWDVGAGYATYALTGLAAFLLAFLTIPGLGELFMALLIFVLLPMIMVMIAIMATIIFRQGLIVLLVMFSPVAFAMYCLPNTEKYFRKWWDLLFKALLVYPIIAVLFAMANILSVTMASTAHGISGPFAKFLSVVAIFIPLVLIPYSFRLAGGLIGQIHNVANGVGKFGAGKLQERLKAPGGAYDRLRDARRIKQTEQGTTGRALGARLMPMSKKWADGQGLSPEEVKQRTAALKRARVERVKSLEGQKIGQEAQKKDFVGAMLQGDDAALLAHSDLPEASKRLSAERAAASTAHQQHDWARGETAKASANLAAAQLAGSASGINAAQTRLTEAKELEDIAKGEAFDKDSAVQARMQSIANASLFHNSSGARTASQFALSSTGYQYSSGQTGYNEMARSVAGNMKNVTLVEDSDGNVIGARGDAAGSWQNNMNQAQYLLKKSGRYDLGSINNGTGWDGWAGAEKASNSERGRGRVESYHGMAAQKLGKSVVDANGKTLDSKTMAQNLSTEIGEGRLSQQQVAEYATMLAGDRLYATDKNKAEIDKQLQAISYVVSSGGGSPSGPGTTMPGGSSGGGSSTTSPTPFEYSSPSSSTTSSSSPWRTPAPNDQSTPISAADPTDPLYTSAAAIPTAATPVAKPEPSFEGVLNVQSEHSNVADIINRETAAVESKLAGIPDAIPKIDIPSASTPAAQEHARDVESSRKAKALKELQIDDDDKPKHVNTSLSDARGDQEALSGASQLVIPDENGNDITPRIKNWPDADAKTSKKDISDAQFRASVERATGIKNRPLTPEEIEEMRIAEEAGASANDHSDDDGGEE